MHGVQNQDHVSEAPLVLFTVCMPAAVGLAGCSLALGGALPFAALALLLASAGMAGSVFRLARPLSAPGSLHNLHHSALSQEIGAVIAFWTLLALWLAVLIVQPLAADALAAASPGQEPPLWASVSWDAVATAACALVTLWGIALMWVINRAYRIETCPAWDGPEGLMELVSIACGCGGALYALLRYTLAVADGGWGEGGVGAVAPLGAAVPAVTALLAVAAVVLQVVAHTRRKGRLAALASADTRDRCVALTFDNMGELESKALFTLCLFAAAAALELCAVVLAFAPTFAWPLLASWALLSALQLAAAILQRTCFYQLPVVVESVAPLHK